MIDKVTQPGAFWIAMPRNEKKWGDMDTKGYRIFAIVLLGCGNPAVASSQTFPTTTIQLVVPFAPGAGTDALARMVAAGVAKALNGALIVENRAGASANLGANYVARSVPDGHTLIMGAH